MADPQTPTAGPTPAPPIDPPIDWSPSEQQYLTGNGMLPLSTASVKGSEPLPPVPAGTTIDTLLKPTKDVPGDTYVHFGNLQVERALVGDFEAAQRYLAKDPEALSALRQLETGNVTTTVAKINDGQDGFTPSSHTISWDPKSATVNTNGSFQTPANGLLHEEGHAVEELLDPARKALQKGEKNQRYTNGEEQRVITGLETRAHDYLPGEGTRTDHGGRAFDSKGPTSVEPVARGALTDPAQIRAELHEVRLILAIEGYTPPPPPGDEAKSIEPWDHKAHTGSIVHLDGTTVAQYVGGGKYEIYDVQKDLGGHMPPENDKNLTIDAKGVVVSQAQGLDQPRPAPGHSPEPSTIGR